LRYSLAGLLFSILQMHGVNAVRGRADREYPPLAQFGSARHADAVHAFANREYYQVMLAEMEKALTDAGYELTRMNHCA
jgi:hypothetical protein